MTKEKKFLELNDKDFFYNSLLMFNEFNKQSSFSIIANILSSSKNNDKDINLFINSYGGVVDDLMAMIDTINLVKNDVCTIGLGCCASCGAVLLACGKKGKRYMTENARVMIHQISAWAVGKNTDVQIQAKEADRVNKQLAKLLAKATGKTKKQIMEDFKDDKWFSAEEALKYGLIDKIIKSEDINKIPELEGKNLNRNKEKEFVFDYEIKSLEENEENYCLKGIASTSDIDLCNDIVEQEALIKSVEKYGLPSFLYLHRDTEDPLGAIKKVYTENGNTCIEAIMPKKVERNKEVAELLKVGSFRGLSIGYSALKYHYDKNDTRIITDIIWHETSLVNVPCNPNAKIQEFKNKKLNKKPVGNVEALKQVKSLKELEKKLKERGLTEREILTCISKIKELSLNKEKVLPASDLPEKTMNASDLQSFQKSLKILQNTIKKYEV